MISSSGFCGFWGMRVAMIDADIGLRNLDIVTGLESRVVYDIIDVALIAENSATVTPGTVEETGELLPSPDARSYGAGIQ